ncbi:YHYH domain-containing protein [Vibrio panuliri]|uniref:YHYH domain-containing protein n=1 Tax=Vibrio panuliri TaxID=1381081 RepID=UPI0009526AA0
MRRYVITIVGALVLGLGFIPHVISSPIISKPLLSHSGGTDKCGCHYNRKTGEYHCHTRKQRGGDCPA